VVANFQKLDYGKGCTQSECLALMKARSVEIDSSCQRNETRHHHSHGEKIKTKEGVAKFTQIREIGDFSNIQLRRIFDRNNGSLPSI
jgi:hypothetical protein